MKLFIGYVLISLAIGAIETVVSRTKYDEWDTGIRDVIGEIVFTAVVWPLYMVIAIVFIMDYIITGRKWNQ